MDIKIICNEDKSIICKRNILLESPHFAKVLQPPWKEYNENLIQLYFDIDVVKKYLKLLGYRQTNKCSDYYKYFLKHNIFEEKDIEFYEYLLETDLVENIVYKKIEESYEMDEDYYDFNIIFKLPYIDLNRLSKNILISICEHIHIRSNLNWDIGDYRKNKIETYIKFINLIIDHNSDVSKLVKAIFLTKIHAPIEIIQHLIYKKINLNCIISENRNSLLHMCYRKYAAEKIMCLIDYDINLECIDTNGMRPIHYICQYSTPEMIKYIIDKGVELECANNNGARPIHYICKYSTPEMIKYIIDKGVELNCKSYTLDTPSSIIINRFNQKNIKDVIEFCLDNMNNKKN